MSIIGEMKDEEIAKLKAELEPYHDLFKLIEKHKATVTFEKSHGSNGRWKVGCHGRWVWMDKLEDAIRFVCRDYGDKETFDG